MQKRLTMVGLAVTVSLAAAAAYGHFRLLEPASWIEENERGDPQKVAPCGGSIADGGTRTGAVTELEGGSMFRLVVDETIYHPGHFRVSLARRINALPPSPEAELAETERGLRSASFPIDGNPQPPVLVDGLWENYERRTGILETEIRMPNFDCANCFLQVVQFMVDHPGVAEGGYTYHHCAIVNITANEDLPIDEGW
jgi:hypothetical protein